MTILSLVSEHLGDNVLETKGGGIYRLNFRGGQHNGSDWSSLVIWEHNDSFFHYAKRIAGGPKYFAKYVLGLPDSIVNEIPESQYRGITSTIRELDSVYHKRDYNLFDIIGKPGYNEYISSRNITEDTARHFGLEILDDNVVIPLYENSRRTGSIIRYNTLSKASRYRTFLIEGYDKVHCWPESNLKKLNSESVIILVEGAWSLMRMHQVFTNEKFVPLATLGVTLSNSLKMKLFEYPIIGVLDNDSGGETVKRTLEEWKKDGLNTKTYIPSRGSKIDDILFGPLYVDEMSTKQLKEMEIALDSL